MEAEAVSGVENARDADQGEVGLPSFLRTMCRKSTRTKIRRRVKLCRGLAQIGRDGGTKVPSPGRKENNKNIF